MSIVLGGAGGKAPPVAQDAKGAELYRKLSEEIRRLDAMAQVALVAAFEKRQAWDRLPGSLRIAFERAAR